MSRLRLQWRVITGGVHILIEPAEPLYQRAGMHYSASVEGVPRHFMGNTEAAAIGNLLLEWGEAFGLKIERRERTTES